MADFAKALAYVLENEGGFSDNPDDPGGATNCGITLSTLQDFSGEDQTVEHLKKLTKEDIEIIYHEKYWSPLFIWEQSITIPDSVATAIFDIAVNQGVRRAITLSQKSCVSLGFTSTGVDGFMGPKTLQNLSKVAPEEFIRELHERVVSGYKRLVQVNPRLKVFLKGWLNRANRLLTLV